VALENLMEICMGLPKWNVANFVSTIAKIYPFSYSLRSTLGKAEKTYKVTPCSLEQYTSEDPTLKTKLSTLLNDYFRAVENNDSNGRKDCTFKVVSSMQLRVQFGQMKSYGTLA